MRNAFWEVRATVVDELNGFRRVVTRVEWKLTVHKSGQTATQRGVVDIPPPTNPATFIDLDDLQGKSEEERRAVVLGWAEMVWPGFVDAKVSELLRQISDRPEPPAKTIKIL